MRLFAALSGMFVFSLVSAAEYPIDIKTDLKGTTFFVVEKGGTENNPTLVVKRVNPARTTYTKRLFDCKAHTVRYLGEGDSLEAIAKATPEKDAYPIAEGSIPDQLAKHVCPK
jgi:hypothetical protein